MNQFLGVDNVNEFYGDHYLAAIASTDVARVAERWREILQGDEYPPRRFANLHKEYFRARQELAREKDFEALAAKVLDALGYAAAPVLRPLGARFVPLLTEVNRPDGAPLVWAIASLPGGDGELPVLTRRIPQAQVERLAPLAARVETLAPEETLEDVVTSVFDLDEPPRFVLIVSEGELLLCERSKWPEKRLLRFELSEILGRRDEPTLQLCCALLHRTSLAPDSGAVVLDTFDDNSHKHAHAVSEDLKYALRECIELLGNEAVRQLRERKEKIFTEDRPAELASECMRYMYRLLFLFYVESRPELGWAPVGVESWEKGYGLERLRAFEQVEFETEEDRNGSYLNECLSLLFKMVFEGAKPASQMSLESSNSEFGIFTVSPLKSHLFDPARTRLLNKVVFPNHVLQQVIEKMSLSRGKGRQRRGRISYATLGISQLGAVYEALLSFRGFFAKEELFELYPKGEEPGPLDPAWFVTKSQLEEYSQDEREGKKPEKGGARPGLKRYSPGTFIYRMSGRDRQKSASYYTPQSLTKATVEYTLREILFDAQGNERLSADEVLQLTVLEPAVGSAAFLNEAIDQLAEVYLHRKQRELGKRIPLADFGQEKQRVKMFIADRNVFGIDLNPVAIELAEVSLWLNTIHKGAFVPWFGCQLVRGNSLIGARRDVFSRDEVVGGPRQWLKSVPQRVVFGAPRPEGAIWHFLIPEEGMAVYGGGTEGAPIREQYADEIALIDSWREGMCAPVDESEHEALVDLSKAVDQLWERHVSELRSIRERTTDPLSVFGHEKEQRNPTTTHEKDEIQAKELSSDGVRASSPYRRLKLAMDYWCALWFWPIERASLLPTRAEMLADLMLLLDSSLVQEHDATKAGETRDLFATTKSTVDAKRLVQELGFVDVPRLLAKRPRLQVANELAEQHGFLHQELEFADLYADRGGFDVILGNPPWIKLEWSEAAVLSDIDPAFALKDLNADAVAKRRHTILGKSGVRKVWTEQHEFASGTQAFLTALQNYPELKGQQPNLYKCFLPRAWRNERAGGASGFLHPEGVYDDPKAGAFRRTALLRVRRHYQFQNEFGLFEGTNDHGRMRFSLNVYASQQTAPRFVHIANLFEPKTIRACHEHHGQGAVPGIKDEENNWSTAGHRARIVEVGTDELELFAQLYDEEGTPPTEARVPALHARTMVPTLKRFAAARTLGRAGVEYFPHYCFDESRGVRAGTIRRETRFPESPSELVLSGPHFFVGAPIYKSPRRECTASSHYDVVDLTAISDDYLPRTNYVRACSREEFDARTPRVSWEIDGRRPRLTELFRVVVNRGLSPPMERTLQPAIICPGPAHIDGVYTYSFRENRQVVLTAATWGALPIDFFIKSTGSGDFRPNLGRQLPLSLGEEAFVVSRTLGLNCLTSPYAQLWDELSQACAGDGWTRDDPRLPASTFDCQGSPWNRASALRTDYARRQALVELDVLVSMGLGITLEQLVNIYRAQFPIMREYERDTWYDRNGRVVFTTSKGLSTVGLSRYRERGSSTPGWEEVRDMKSGSLRVVIDDDTMPGGPRQRAIGYEAPFDRCDREADYTQAWSAFKRRGL